MDTNIWDSTFCNLVYAKHIVFFDLKDAFWEEE